MLQYRFDKSTRLHISRNIVIRRERKPIVKYDGKIMSYTRKAIQLSCYANRQSEYGEFLIMVLQETSNNK